MNLLKKQTSNTIVMVRPLDFEYNEQTGQDNEFQNKPTANADEVHKQVLAEFDTMTSRLKAEGVTILIMEKHTDTNKTPDAVFPNNWFTAESDGTIVMFPMKTINRRHEKRITQLEDLLETDNFLIKNVLNIGKFNEDREFLEGTGCLIFDHINQIIYVALSQRSSKKQLDNYMALRNYKEAVVFHTSSSNGKAIYHTNVMLSIGDKFAVICSASITDKNEREKTLKALAIGREVIDISMEQMEKSFCANILQVHTNKNESLIVMSRSAYNGFTEKQKTILEKYGKLFPVDINTIETIGGGSARCMMAEVFLPKQ